MVFVMVVMFVMFVVVVGTVMVFVMVVVFVMVFVMVFVGTVMVFFHMGFHMFSEVCSSFRTVHISQFFKMFSKFSFVHFRVVFINMFSDSFNNMMCSWMGRMGSAVFS